MRAPNKKWLSCRYHRISYDHRPVYVLQSRLELHTNCQELRGQWNLAIKTGPLLLFYLALCLELWMRLCGSFNAITNGQCVATLNAKPSIPARDSRCAHHKPWKIVPTSVLLCRIAMEFGTEFSRLPLRGSTQLASVLEPRLWVGGLLCIGRIFLGSHEFETKVNAFEFTQFA